MRASRPRQIEAYRGMALEGRRQRRPDARRTTEAVDHQHGAAAADRRLDLEGDDLSPPLPHHATESGRRLRAERIPGSLWNVPSFMMASSRAGSCRIAILASGSPSTR